jgi:NAD(P)-dependent dehydrogenase (short-subunit alcohol dehydrogenase family)
VDSVVANAGFPILQSFEEATLANIEYGFRGNVFSFCSIARAAASPLAQSPAGRIVVVGSFTSHVFRTDVRQFPLSPASKGARDGRTEPVDATRCAWRHRKLRGAWRATLRILSSWQRTIEGILDTATLHPRQSASRPKKELAPHPTDRHVGR